MASITLYILALLCFLLAYRTISMQWRTFSDSLPVNLDRSTKVFAFINILLSGVLLLLVVEFVFCLVYQTQHSDKPICIKIGDTSNVELQIHVFENK